MNKQKTTIYLLDKTIIKLKGMAQYHGLSNSQVIEKLVLEKRFNGGN